METIEAQLSLLLMTYYITAIRLAQYTYITGLKKVLSESWVKKYNAKIILHRAYVFTKFRRKITLLQRNSDTQ